MRTTDEIKTIPIQQVIGAYIQLKPAGRHLRGICPFHDDSDPSLVVYPETGTWFCFGKCHEGGDVISFVMKAENISFREAIQRLSEGWATTLSQSPPRLRPREGVVELNDEHIVLLTAAAEVYHAELLKTPRALEYLAQRGFSADVARRYRLGFASGRSLEKYFRLRGWDIQVGMELGLFQKSKSGGVREYFKDRLVIPEWRHSDQGNRAVYLVGRATCRWQRTKYLGLAGVPKPIYGWELIKDSPEVYIVEGPFDWLTLAHWGYPAVATLGHPKRDHLVTLARLPNLRTVYVVTDSDEAGRAFAMSIQQGIQHGISNLRVVILPPLQGVKDINELLQREGKHAANIFAQLVRLAR